jgi:hypothetical protein
MTTIQDVFDMLPDSALPELVTLIEQGEAAAAIGDLVLYAALVERHWQLMERHGLNVVLKGAVEAEDRRKHLRVIQGGRNRFLLQQ